MHDCVCFLYNKVTMFRATANAPIQACENRYKLKCKHAYCHHCFEELKRNTLDMLPKVGRSSRRQVNYNKKVVATNKDVDEGDATPKKTNDKTVEMVIEGNQVNDLNATSKQ